MTTSALHAIAYLKADAPPAAGDRVVSLDLPDSPVLTRLAGDLLVAYVLDEGDQFSYVQERDLTTHELDAGQLHARACANLAELAQGRVIVRQNGPTWALFFDGNFEASLALLDHLWDDALLEYHGGEPVIAVPARDILCFCPASSPGGIDVLRTVIGRVWPRSDHLISRQLFHRRGAQWLPLDSLS